MVFQDEQLAKEHHPELRFVTDNIEEVYSKVSASHPHLLHPNLGKVTVRPWGAKEFAISDKQPGIRFQTMVTTTYSVQQRTSAWRKCSN